MLNNNNLMLFIKIIGIEQSRENEALKQNLQAAMSYFKNEFHVQEVNDVDEIMEEDIEGIPALVLGDKTVFQKEVPTVLEISNALKKHLQEEEKKWVARTILVPTDFSPAAQSAFQYTQQLASVLNADIKVIHCYHPNIDSSYPFNVESEEAHYQLSKRKLYDFVEAGQTSFRNGAVTTEKRIEYDAVRGFAVDEIVRLSRSPEVDLIAMATTGEHGVLDKLFGTVSSTIGKEAHCPVLLIPDKVEFKSFDKILFAISNEAVKEDRMRELLFISQLFNSELHFVHICSNAQNNIKISTPVMERLDIPTSRRFIFNKQPASSVVEGISEYAEEENIDLIVMLTHHRNQLAELLHKSQTRRMALNTHIPLLIMHWED